LLYAADDLIQVDDQLTAVLARNKLNRVLFRRANWYKLLNFEFEVFWGRVLKDLNRVLNTGKN